MTLRDAWPILAFAAIAGGIIAGSVALVALGVLVGAACYGATLWARDKNLRAAAVRSRLAAKGLT